MEEVTLDREQNDTVKFCKYEFANLTLCRNASGQSSPALDFSQAGRYTPVHVLNPMALVAGVRANRCLVGSNRPDSDLFPGLE